MELTDNRKAAVVNSLSLITLNLLTCCKGNMEYEPSTELTYE